jgi:hypothetical protein
LQDRLDRGRARLFQHMAAVSGALLAGKLPVAGRRMEELTRAAEDYAELVAAVLDRPAPGRRHGGDGG